MSLKSEGLAYLRPHSQQILRKNVIWHEVVGGGSERKKGQQERDSEKKKKNCSWKLFKYKAGSPEFNQSNLENRKNSTKTQGLRRVL